MARDLPPDMLHRAVLLYQQRRLPEADKLLTQILQRAPNKVDALHLAGLIARESERLPRAATLLGKAVRLAPHAAPLLDALAGVLHDLGRTHDALAHWRQATQIDPAFADAWVNLGALLNALGRPDEAVASYDRALATEPNFAEAHYNRALALSLLHQREAALDSIDRCIALNPGFADAHVGRGTILADLKRDGEALASFHHALTLRPDHAKACYNAGTSLLGLSRFAEADQMLSRAIALKPDYADAYRNRAIALLELDRFEEAISCQRKALTLQPDFAFLAGDLLQSRLTVCDWEGLAAATADVAGRIAKGGLVCAPFTSLLAFSDPVLQRTAGEIYTTAKYPPDNSLGPMPPRSRNGKIRVGYFSADFRDHPVSQLMIGLFQNHDRARFHTVGFTFGPDTDDAMARRVAASFDEFIDVRALSDAAVARLAREKNIDIAVDLGGHTKHARTGIFALRAAPIQIGYIGFLGTMGADYIDYIVADKVLIPEDTRQHFSEKIAYLPSYQANPTDRIVSEAPVSRTDAGLPDDAFVFCCFNNSFKIMPDMFATWIRILQAVPGSILWLYVTGDVAERNIRTASAAMGLSAERIVFARRVPHADYLARLRLADLFLDTAPYNAGTTASDALWMGLPVVTHLGTSFAGRMGASLLTAVGMPELIAASPNDYERKAIDLAHNPSRLAELRRVLSDNRATTALFDAEQFAQSVEATYIKITERRHAGLPPDHIGLPK